MPEPFDIAVLNVDRVLFVGQQNAFLDPAAPQIVHPHGQAAFQSEFDRRQGWQLRPSPTKSRGPANMNFFARHAEALGKPVQHHEAAQRVWQCGNQQPVIAARNGPQHGPRGIPAKAVGDQPFLREVRVYAPSPSAKLVSTRVGVTRLRSSASRALPPNSTPRPH